MSLDWCKKCGGIIWDWKRHRCSPWEGRYVYGLDEDEEPEEDAWEEVRMFWAVGSAEDAAEKLAQTWDDENDLVEGSEALLVEVRSLGEKWQRFRVTAELTVTYTTEKVDV